VSRRARHLREERLFECYLAERNGQPVDPSTADHLALCESCATRYADVASLLEAARSEGLSQADAVFTAERLRAQHQRIVRRIEPVLGPARVISFPSRVVRRTISASASHIALRSIAAAAAAGLFVGVALGASYQYGSHARRTEGTLARQTPAARLIPVATRGSGPAPAATDDAILTDLELALERPHTRELLAFDAFTPHVRPAQDR
jgi:hypothetical protein